MSSLTPTSSLPSPPLTPVSVVTSSTDTVVVSSTVSNSPPSTSTDSLATSASATLPPVGNGEAGTDTETSTVSISPTPGSATTTATSVSSTGPLTTPSAHTSASTVESSETASPVSSPSTSTQTGPESMSTTSTRTPPPANNGPTDDPDASPTPPPTPTSSNSSTTMSTSTSTSTRTPPPANNGEDDETSSSTVTSTRSSSTTGRPPASPSSPSGSSTSTRPSGSGSSTTTREGSSSPAETAVTRNPTSTVTSVTVIRTQNRGTTSTTVTLRATSTLDVAQAITETFADGSEVTTIPPFLTVYSTRTEADGSVHTETQIVANPPSDVGALDGSNRGVLSRAGAAAGIFATVGVLVTALGFIAFLLWRRRRQTNRRQRWLAGMRQQRPDSIGGFPFGQDPAPPAGRVSGSHRGDGPPGLGGAVTSDDEDSVRLPWDESRRIPAQRAEMRERGGAGLAGAGSAAYHGRRPVEQDQRDTFDEPSSPFGTGSRPTNNNPQDAYGGSVSKNPFTGGILGLTRSGSASTTSSAASHSRHGNKNAGQASVGGRPRQGSINKNSISLPVPVPSPTRKPAIYTDDPFVDKLGLSPITERTSLAPSSVNMAGVGTTAPPSVAGSNWAQRQHLVPPHSPAPSTPSMYPPTLPADDEMDETGEFDSDATMEKVGQKQSNLQGDNGGKSVGPSSYKEVSNHGAFQNLFVLPSRPRAPAPAPPPIPQHPAISRVPPAPLKINTNTSTSAIGDRGSTSSLTATAPPRPPRSILRTSANGSLSALGSPTSETQAQAKRQGGSTEFIPLTPPSSSHHSPNTTYTTPGGIRRSNSWSKTNLNGGQVRPLGQPQQQASPPMSPVIVQEKVQEILANRRLLLDVRRRSVESNSS